MEEENIASQILQKHVDELKKGKRLRILSRDAVHDMRVATRRLRAALKTFKTIFPPPAQKLRKGLKQTARLLGKKRDLDVFQAFLLQTLDAKPGGFPKLAKHLAISEKQILAELRTRRFASLLEDLERMDIVKSYNICKIAKKHIQNAFKRVLELKGNDKELHPLRIHLKKLRYTCEFFTSLFSLDKLIEKTKEVQDLLGEHQDAITGIALLKRYRDQFSTKQFKKVKDAFKQQQKDRRRSFAKTWIKYHKLAEKTLAKL